MILNYFFILLTFCGADGIVSAVSTRPLSGGRVKRDVNTTSATTQSTVNNQTNVTNEPTTTSTASEQFASALARISASVRITNVAYTGELEIPITDGFRSLSDRVKTTVFNWLLLYLPATVRPQSVRVERFLSGSVVAELTVMLHINGSSADQVETTHLMQQVLGAVRPQENSVNGLQFDTNAAQVTNVEVIEPTPPPATTESSYEFSRVMFSMRAPNEIYTDEMNITSSEQFVAMQQNLRTGVVEMLAKRYTAEEGWTVETRLFRVWNDTEKGLWFRFTVTVSPQWKNTTETLINMGTNYVYFSRLGGYQVDPTSVSYKDLTTYAPDMGMVVMDNEYIQQLAERKYNGSYVGDFSTERPFIRPQARVHRRYIMDVAIPSFAGMMMTLALLLICTTTDSHKEKFYQAI